MAHDDGVQWYVHYGRLAAAAEGAAGTADSLRKGTHEARQRSVAVAHEHEGLRCAASLGRLHGAYSAVFDGHVETLHGIGRRLADNHRTYHLAENGAQAGVAEAPAAGLTDREV